MLLEGAVEKVDKVGIRVLDIARGKFPRPKEISQKVSFHISKNVAFESNIYCT